MSGKPSVFISYSHDDAAHERRVLALADRLRTCGIDASIDQYVSFPEERWPAWCKRQIEKADHVVLVCTETYRRRVDGEEQDGVGRGVCWEAPIIQQLLYDKGARSRKFVPVLFAGGSAEHVPVEVRGFSRFVVDEGAGFEDLCRLLLNKPRTPMPPLGDAPELPPDHRPWLARHAASADRGLRPEMPPVRIFLSSPGDVAEEREMARMLIESELPKRPAFRERLALRLVAWDYQTPRIPKLATQTAQDPVNDARPRPADCDIVVVILWARMGTPLSDTICKPDGAPYLSSTEWEYEDAVGSARQPKPVVLVYRRTEKPKVELDDPDFADKATQFQRVKAFLAQFRNADSSLAGGVNAYATPAEFKVLLSQHLEELLYRRLPAYEAVGEPRPTAPIIPPEYVAWLRRSLERVELLGAKEGRSVTLDHVYVPALTRASPASSEAVARSERKRREQAEEQRPTPLLQRLDAESLYVPAPAGAGKSTFCRWAALQSITGADITHPVPAPQAFAERVPASLRGRLPLLIPLREFWRSMHCGRGERLWKRANLERALVAWIDASPPDGLTGALLLAHFAAGSAFLLLDGLDEVAVTDTQARVTLYPRELLLSGLAEALPAWLTAGNRVVLTSRPYGLDEAGLHRLGLPVASLEPLPEELQHLFVRRWFNTLGKPDKVEDLIATIRDRDDLAPLVDNPMLLTALCVLYDNGGRLPEDRYELYKSIVGGVLHNRYPGDASQRDPVERRLEAIALGMHTRDNGGRARLTPAAEISWVETERLLAGFANMNPAYETDQVEVAVRRENLLNRSGLLVPRPNERAAFYHLSFQEFLAAQRLARTADDVERVFRDQRAVPEWRATLLFLFAAQIANRDAEWGLRLLGRLIEDEDRVAVKADPAAAVFLAEALELCLAKKFAVPDALRGRFCRLALHAIDDEIAVHPRQALGLCLGRLGDPRIRGLRDPEAYVEVPAGRYPFGGKGKNVEIAAPFRIGRYLVTNGQYAEFIGAGGYTEQHWWSDAGLAWLQAGHVTEPARWYDRRWNAPNQPVVGVSFWEAQACCRWAGDGTLGGSRLPSEQEWEAAARGPKGLEYPWGNEWEHGICNTAEAGLGVTSSVGLFPRSRQAELGIEDQAGNVWEWCDDPQGEDFPVARVLRGGSWGIDRDFARSAYRVRYRPLDRSYSIGFRVVCSSPIFDP